MTPATYIRRRPTLIEGEPVTADDLMVEVRPHEAVNAEYLGWAPDRQKRTIRDLAREEG